MVPRWSRPSEPCTVTAVPSGAVAAPQPSVSADPPVPAQCAACPRSTRGPSVKTKSAVQEPPPSVSVRTPGCTPARPAGAHPVTTGEPGAAACGAARAAGARSAPRPTTAATAAVTTVPRALTIMSILPVVRPDNDVADPPIRPGRPGTPAPRHSLAKVTIAVAVPLTAAPPPLHAAGRRIGAARPLPWGDRSSSPCSGGPPPGGSRQGGRPREAEA